MSFRRIIKGSLISLTVLGMVGGSLNNNVANAKHRRHHYRYTRLIKRNKHYRRNHKLYRHHRKIHFKYYKRNYQKRHYIKRYLHKHRHSHKVTILKHMISRNYRVRKSHSDIRQSTKYSNLLVPINKKAAQKIANDLRQRTYIDINKSREMRGIQPVQESSNLDEIANIRAHQLDTGMNTSDPHVDPKTGYSYADEVGYNLGFNSDPSNEKYAENAAGCILGSDTDCEGYTYVAKNGTQLADEAEQNMVNHDQDEGNGHRDNILSDNNTEIGVGTDYDPKTGTFNLAEDFDDDPINNDTDDESNNTNNDSNSQGQASYNYNSNNNNNGSSSSISESSDDGSNNININNNNNNTTSSNSDNDYYVNPLEGKTIHKNGVTVTYTKDGMIARDNNGDTSSASGPNSTINIDGQTFTD